MTLKSTYNTKLIIFAIISVVIGNLFILYHLSHEHYIYFWDISGYWISGIEFTKILFSRPLDALQQLYKSILDLDYNLLPVVPLSIIFKIVSASHKVYTLAIYNFYVVPFTCLSLHFYNKILVDNHTYSDRKMIFAGFMLFTYTALLTPVLFGYLDAIGLPIIALILLLTYQNGFNKFKMSNAIIIAFLLVALTLLRRWYLFWVVSFFVSLLAIYLIKLFTQKKYSFKKMIQELMVVAAIGTGYLLILGLFFRRFLIRVLKNNFQDAYKAYSGGDIFYNISHLFGFFSVLFMVFVLIGIILLIIKKNTRFLAIFLTIQSIVIFVLFTRVQSFGSQHVYLFVPTFSAFALLGIVFGLDYLKNKWLKISAYAIVICLLTINFGYTYIGDTKVTDFAKPLLAEEILRPRVMNDINEIKEMANYINSLTANTGKTAYVVASSFIINDEILSNVELPRIRYAVEGLVATNHVDRRDGFPNQFLMADIVVVADPVQYHLAHSEQQTVGVIADRILKAKPANLQLLKSYSLDKGVTAHVYQRTEAYSKEFLDDLAQTFQTSYPQHSNLNTISYFYGLMNHITVSPPSTRIYYNNSRDILIDIGAGQASFDLENKKTFKKLSFDVNANNNPNQAVIKLSIYNGSELVIEDTITEKKNYSIDVSSADTLKFEVNSIDQKFGGIILENICLE